MTVRVAGTGRGLTRAAVSAIRLPSHSTVTFRRQGNTMQLRASSCLPLVFAAGLSGCVIDSNPGTGDGAVAGCAADYGTTLAAQQLETFVAAVGTFGTEAAALDSTLRTECAAIANDLGATAADFVPTGAETPTAVACRVAAQRLRGEFVALRGTAGLTVSLQVVPPQCTVDVDAYSRCVASCDATYRPGMVTLACEGGELRGTCSGSCTGSCAAMATAACAGSCEGTCTGSCTGVCQGACDGTCATRDGAGNCNGTCMGTCSGTCSAGCTGSCTGRCVVAASARCEGECRGMCSVAFTAPRCTGRVVPPMIDVDCRASCDTRIRATAECTPGQASLRVEGTVSADLMARAARLRATLVGHYGAILTAARRLAVLTEAGVVILQTADRIPGAAVTLGLSAVGCAASTVRDIRIAVPQVTVSVQASVAVSGSVSAQ